MLRRLVLILSVALFIGCATGEQVSMNVHEGMTKEDLAGVIGRPDGYKRAGNQEVYSYADRVISGWDVRARADYYFIFENDQLIEWGTGQVRTHPTNTGTMVFIPIKTYYGGKY